MRIRKNAKISPLVYMKSFLKPGTVIQTYDCRLNRSPWDVMDLISRPPQTPPPRPPVPPQVQINDIYVENGSHLDIFPLVKRESSISVPTEEAEPPRKDEDEPAVISLCGKKDGKGGFCLREAAKGSFQCQRHSSMARKSSNTVTRPEKITPDHGEAQVKDQANKAPTSSSSYLINNHNYTLFKARWGRKRGRGTSNDNGAHRAGEDSVQHLGRPSELSDQFDDDADDEKDDDSYRRKKAKKPTKARSLKSL